MGYYRTPFGQAGVTCATIRPRDGTHRTRRAGTRRRYCHGIAEYSGHRGRTRGRRGRWPGHRGPVHGQGRSERDHGRAVHHRGRARVRVPGGRDESGQGGRGRFIPVQPGPRDRDAQGVGHRGRTHRSGPRAPALGYQRRRRRRRIRQSSLRGSPTRHRGRGWRPGRGQASGPRLRPLGLAHPLVSTRSAVPTGYFHARRLALLRKCLRAEV